MTRESDAPSAPEPGVRGPEHEHDVFTDLLRRCADRDAKALEVLYRRSSARLLGCLVRLLRRRDLAEEVLQDVYLQILERAGQFEAHRGRSTAWMISIARHRAIDTFRRERPELLQSLESARMDAIEGSRVAARAAPPEADSGRSLREEEALAICLQQLEPEPRECIQLAFLRGLSQVEVAAARRLPLGTTKSWIRRGLLTLRECIELCIRRRPT